MEKAAQLQTQIKQNNHELRDFLKDLTRWEERVKDEDRNLKTERKLEEKLPPIRSKVKKSKVSTDVDDKESKEKPKSERISSYDYDAWSKFDADAACKSDSDEENDESVEEDEEEDEEELERIKQEKSLQKAVLEKEKGNQLFKEGKYEAAINRYTSAIACHPSNPVLYGNRGMALIKSEKYAAAEQDCNLALQLDPKFGKAIARRGIARKKLKKYKEALEDFTNLFELEPKNQQAIQEIKDIKKLLQTGKETKEKETIKIMSNDATRNISKATQHQPVKRRSNKPLKRIHIAEVGIDDESDEKTETLRNDRVPQGIHNISQTNGSVETPIPTTSFMFETEFKKLKNDKEQLYSYLKIIPLTDYDKLFYQSIDNLVSPFIHIIKDCYIRDKIHYHEEMKTVSCIKRFDMAIMFLSRKDKDALASVINHLSSESYMFRLEKEFITALAKKYSVKL